MGNYSLRQRIVSVTSTFVEIREAAKRAAADAYLAERDDEFRQYSTLRAEIEEMLPRVESLSRLLEPPGETKTSARFKLGKSLPTDVSEFREVYLHSLRELGGRSKLKPLFNQVEAHMRPQLNEADYAFDTPSDPNKPRWRATLYDLTYQLEAEGVLKKISRGVYALA